MLGDARMEEVVRSVGWGIREKWRSLHREVRIDRPIFVVGLQAGGLTLIRRILTRAPNMVTVGGNTRLWYGSDEMQNRVAKKLPEALRLFHCRYHMQGDFHRGAWLYGTDRYLHHFRKTEEDVTPELRSAFERVLRSIIARNALQLDGCRFIDKSQTYGLKISFLGGLLEAYDPKFLIVAMNPYAICTKVIDRPALSLLPTDDAGRLRLAAQHYANCMGAMIRDAARTDSTLLLRFEDFLAAPREFIARCCRFLEIPYSDGMMPSPEDTEWAGRKWYPIRRDVVERRLRQIDDEEVRIVNRWVAPLFEGLGYDMK